jgi:hypothetical protein
MILLREGEVSFIKKKNKDKKLIKSKAIPLTDR